MGGAAFIAWRKRSIRWCRWYMSVGVLAAKEALSKSDCSARGSDIFDCSPAAPLPQAKSARCLLGGRFCLRREEREKKCTMTWHDGEREVLGFWACSFVLKNIRTITDWHSRLQRDKLQREACVRIGANPRGTKVSERPQADGGRLERLPPQRGGCKGNAGRFSAHSRLQIVVLQQSDVLNRISGCATGNVSKCRYRRTK